MLLSWIGFVLAYLLGSSTDAVGMIRSLRVIRLITQWPRMHKLGVAIIHGLPAVLNVIMVYMILLAFFSVVAVEAFGSVRYGFSLNQMANFSHFWEAMTTLARVSLGSWRGIMYDVTVTLNFVMSLHCNATNFR